MKTLRLTLAVLGGLLVLAIVAAVVFASRFDPNDYKDAITAYVQQRTGRTLTIGRDIELSLFPWFAVETGGVSLSDDPEFGDRDLITIDSLSARVRVWPLLRRQVEIGRVGLDGIELNLAMDADGRGNWTSLLDTAVPTGTAPASDAAAESAGPLVETLAVAGIELRNARILWFDPNGAVRYRVDAARIETGPIRDQAPIELALELNALDLASQSGLALELETLAEFSPTLSLREIEASVRLSDTSDPQRAELRLSLASLTRSGERLVSSPAHIEARLNQLPAGPPTLSLIADIAGMEFDTASEDLVVDGLTARSGDTGISLSLAGQSVLSDPRLTGTAEIRSGSIAELLAMIDPVPPADRDLGGLGGISGSFAFTAGTNPLAVELTDVTVDALGLQARGAVSLGADNAVNARVSVPAFRPNDALREFLAGYVPAGTDLAAIAQVSAGATVVLPADRSRIDLNELSLGLDGARLTGNLSMAGSPPGTGTTRGSVSIQGLDNRLLQALLGASLPAELLAADLGEFRLVTGVEHNSASARTVLRPIDLTAFGLAGSGEVTIDTSGPALALAGRAQLAEFSPRELLARFDLPAPESSDPAVLGSAQLAASFETSGASGRFRDIAITLDQSRITGQFSVDNFADPSYRFALDADRINADRYLPPESEDPGAAAGPAGQGTDQERTLGEMRIDREALSATNISGTATIGELIIGGMRFEQFSSDLAVGDGRLAVNAVQTRLYDGSFEGSLLVDATAAPPRVRLTGTAADLAMQALLDALIGDSSLSGTGNFRMDLAGSGETLADVLASTDGSLNAAFSDGAIAGINVSRELCAAMNAVNSLPAPAAAPDVTRFSLIRGSATVTDGIATTSDLFATAGPVELTGSGRIRLADQWLRNDYIARLKGPIEYAGCDRLNSRIDGSIPIGFWLEGNFPDVDFGFDLKQLIEDWARRELRERAQDAVRDRVGDALRGLLN